MPLLRKGCGEKGAALVPVSTRRDPEREALQIAFTELVIRTIAIHGYRSLRELVLPLEQLTVITGANGSGKSSVYRSLRLLADAALNAVIASLAREGGLASTFWAGPETIARSVRRGEHAVEGLAKKKCCKSEAWLWRRYIWIQH